MPASLLSHDVFRMDPFGGGGGPTFGLDSFSDCYNGPCIYIHTYHPAASMHALMYTDMMVYLILGPHVNHKCVNVDQ